MKNIPRNTLGKIGERKAWEFLKREGYRPIRRSYRSRQGEIDIIAWDGAYLCFIEVKTRAHTTFDTPITAVNRWKRRRIVKTARHYIVTQKFQDTPIRYDIVGVYHDGGAAWRFELLREAFNENDL